LPNIIWQKGTPRTEREAFARPRIGALQVCRLGALTPSAPAAKLKRDRRAIILDRHDNPKVNPASEETVRSHFKKAQAELETRNRTHTVSEAMRNLMII
jgi:hypothetical protein